MHMTKEQTKSGLTFYTSGVLILTAITNTDAQVSPNSFKHRNKRLQIF